MKKNKKLDGVESSNVNIATEKLNIEYDNQKLKFEDIKLSIINLKKPKFRQT